MKKLLLGLTLLASLSSFANLNNAKIENIQSKGSSTCSTGQGGIFGNCNRYVVGYIFDYNSARKKALKNVKRKCENLKYYENDVLHSEVVSEPKIIDSDCGYLGAGEQAGKIYGCSVKSQIVCKVERG